MSPPDTSLSFIVYAPELEANDSRILASVHGMERAFPGLRLEWKVSKQGVPIALPRRDEWLAEAASRKEFPLVCNGDESYPVTIFGLETPAGLAPAGRALFDVHAHLPLDARALSTATDVLANLAESCQAYWGVATPSLAAVEIAEQTYHEPPWGKPLPRGLPYLKLLEQLPSTEIPHRPGWLNFWSAATVATLGFPDPARDAEILTRSRRTSSGGWIVQLTDMPLDLDIPSHLNALKRLYARFPQIGGSFPP